MSLLQQTKQFLIIGKKKELKTKCHYVIYSVIPEPKLSKWYDVINLKNKHRHMVRLDELEGQPTCTCYWGSQCIASGDFSVECWHVKSVREAMKK